MAPQQVINEKAKNSIFRFLAMDASGFWFFYQNEPGQFEDANSNIWLPDGNDKIEACDENIAYKGYWKNSLHKAEL